MNGTGSETKRKPHGGGKRRKRSEGSELRAVVVELKKAKQLIDKNLVHESLEKQSYSRPPSCKATARHQDWKRSEFNRKAHGQGDR